MAGGGALSQTLTKAVGAAGEVVDTSVGTGKARSQWLADHLQGGPVRLDGPAQARLGEHLGSDMGRLAGLLDTLAAAYGRGATVTAADLEPFLGEAGALAPWDLTDAIDAGRTAPALEVLHRMLSAGESHPLVILALLHKHYRQMLRLDGAGVTSPEQAAEVLGHQERLPGQEGPGPGQPAGHGPDRPGRAAAGRGRPRPARHHRAVGGAGRRGAGGPAQPPGPPGPLTSRPPPTAVPAAAGSAQL